MLKFKTSLVVRLLFSCFLISSTQVWLEHKTYTGMLTDNSKDHLTARATLLMGIYDASLFKLKYAHKNERYSAVDCKTLWWSTISAEKIRIDCSNQPSMLIFKLKSIRYFFEKRMIVRVTTGMKLVLMKYREESIYMPFMVQLPSVEMVKKLV